MTSFSIDLVNRDGSVDRLDLGVLPDAAAGLKRAREFMLVSLSAVAVDLYAGDVFVQRTGRPAALLRRAA